MTRKQKCNSDSNSFCASKAGLCSAYVSYLFIFNDMCRTNYLNICRRSVTPNRSSPNLQVGRTMAADETV